MRKLTKDEIKIFIENIESIISIIQNKDNWCRRAMSRDKDNNMCISIFDEEAVKFCVLGAVYKINSSDITITISLLNELASKEGFIFGIDELNDHSSHEFVIKFLKNCIKRKI